VQPVDSGQGSQQQADAEGDGCRGDEDAQRGFATASQRQAQAEADHPQGSFRQRSLAVAHDDLAVGVGGDAGFVGDEDTVVPASRAAPGHQAHDELAAQRVE
jgi:hypothetical protein